MLRKKTGFPDEGELVMCTVTNVQFHSVFVKIEEYVKTGVIHISEISPGRIRNIRDFVKEGKVIVCKVLRINQERGHIDLSLRRVTEGQKRNKVNEIKQQQLAEKILEFVAKQLKKDLKSVYEGIEAKVFEVYDSLYECFEAAVKDDNLLKELGFPAELIKPLNETIKQRIKPPEVQIGGKLFLKTHDPAGVELIKKCLKQVEAVNKELIKVFYLGAGAYNLIVTSEDYKTAEKILSNAIGAATSFMDKANGTAKFERIEK